jgi:hypothetical protein
MERSPRGPKQEPEDHPWPADPVAERRFPDHWLVTAEDRSAYLAPNRAKYSPQTLWVPANGMLGDDGEGPQAWFMSTPFASCLRCRVSYEQVRGNDFSMLATLNQEGRSWCRTPTLSLAGDAAATRLLIDAQDGPVVLVGPVTAAPVRARPQGGAGAPAVNGLLRWPQPNSGRRRR